MEIEKLKALCHLARLETSDEELKNLSQQLGQILKYFDQLQKIPTDGVEPLVTPVQIEAIYRNDEVEVELDLADVMKNAPEKVGNLFKVPPVV